MTKDEIIRMAKAAGYDVRWHEIFGCFVHVGPFNITNPPTMAGQRLVWVPLDDDGDALRLAVRLRLVVDIGGLAPTHERIYVGGLEGYLAHEPTGADIDAATRRAITRAAAEIEKEADK
jgi:hypothetical protein